MRVFLLLAGLVLISAPSNAQDFEILTLDVRETAPDRVELAVVVQNNRRTASHFSVRVPLAGAAPAQARSGERLASGATTEISVGFDASGLERPYSGRLQLRNHRGDVVDTEAFVLAAPASLPTEGGGSGDGAPPTVTAATGVSMEIPPISPSRPTVSGLRFTIRTGDDDLRNNSALLVRVTGQDREPLTGWNSADQLGNRSTVVWSTIKDSERPGIRSPSWENESTHSVWIRFRDPVPFEDITEIALRLEQGRSGLQLECIGCTDDNWKMDELRIYASLPSPEDPSRTVETLAFYYDAGDRDAEFTAELPVLRLRPIGAYTPGETRLLNGTWQQLRPGRIIR